MPQQQAGELGNQTKIMRIDHFAMRRERITMGIFTHPAQHADHVTPPALSGIPQACPTIHPTRAAHLEVGGLEVFPHSQTGHFLPHLKKTQICTVMINYFQHRFIETFSIKITLI